MKRNNAIQRCPLIDPLALAVACIISLLFANATQQYLNTAKKNFSDLKNQTVVCFQVPQNSSPEDRPDAWGLEKTKTFKTQQKNNSQITVTFDIPQDYNTRLSGYFYGLFQSPVWLPSIPVAYRKLII